jgi:hypothetical protein
MKITINGQHYDSLEAMPPDVRRTYEEAMRALGPALASGQGAGSTQVLTGQAGGLGGSLIVNRTTTVNNRTYGSVDDVPPEVRQQYEAALKAAAPQMANPKTSLHVSVNLSGPQVRTFDDSHRPSTPVTLPLESSTTEAKIRSIPGDLAILVLIALILWAFLGR